MKTKIQSLIEKYKKELAYYENEKYCFTEFDDGCQTGHISEITNIIEDLENIIKDEKS